MVTAGKSQFEIPVLYFRDDSFTALFTADFKKVHALMPSDRLHPVPAWNGRALIAVAAFDYLSTTVGPYGEVGIAIPVVHGRRPIPILPSLLEASWPGAGYLILHLPVTSRVARDGGRSEWGYAKFLSRMDFTNTPEYEECRLEEGGMQILTLRVAKRGVAFPDRRPLVTYTVKNHALIRTTIPQAALVRSALGHKGSFLELGDTHPVARSIRALDIDPRPVLTRYFLDRKAILPMGEVVQSNVRPLDGYAGVDREEGVRHVEQPALTMH